MLIKIWKKGLVVGIVFSFFFLAVNAHAAAHSAYDASNNIHLKGLFKLQSILNINWDGNIEPLQPGGASCNIPLNISCVVTGGIFGEYILWYYRITNQYLDVSLDLEEIPSYCHSSLSTTQLQFPITNTPTYQIVQMTLAVDYTAPAYEALSLKINASVDDKKGPLGLFTIIEGYQRTSMIFFIADYLPLLAIRLEDNVIQTTPGITVNVPIDVKNLGNGKTTVFATIEEVPSGWIGIVTDQVDLEVDENKSMILQIRTPTNFNGNRVFTLYFTPHFSHDLSKMGKPVSVSVLFEVRP